MTESYNPSHETIKICYQKVNGDPVPSGGHFITDWGDANMACSEPFYLVVISSSDCSFSIPTLSDMTLPNLQNSDTYAYDYGDIRSQIANYDACLDGS